MSDKIDPTAAPISADELRMSFLRKEMDKMDVERKAREAEQAKLAAFTDDFLHKHVSQDEIAMVRRLVMNAVKDGKMEAMVYSFPSDLCTESGRAINNTRRTGRRRCRARPRSSTTATRSSASRAATSSRRW